MTLFADRRIPPRVAIAAPVRFVRAKRLSVKGVEQTYEVLQTGTPSTPWFLMARGKIVPPKTKAKLVFKFDGLKGDDQLVPIAWSGCMMLLRRAEFNRLRPVFLKAGRNTFSSQNLHEPIVDEVIITREPQPLMRNRDYPVRIVE